jgi:hypothetical protein
MGAIGTNETYESVLSNRKRIGHQAGLFAFVPSQRADGRTSAGFATRVGNFGAENCAQPRFDERPCAHVFRFFLAPNVLRTLWKWFEHFAQLLFRERIKLLDPNDRCVVNLALGSVIEQVVINFAGAKDDPIHLVGGADFG